MIRHIATVKLRPDTTDDQIEALIAAVLGLRNDGVLALSIGPGLRLRDKDVDFGFVVDFVDEAAFRRFDEDPAHDALRTGLSAQIVEQAQSCQLVV